MNNHKHIYPQFAISLLVIAGFFAYAFTVESKDPVILETLKASFVLVIGFWIGSSHGSKNKDNGVDPQ